MKEHFGNGFEVSVMDASKEESKKPYEKTENKNFTDKQKAEHKAAQEDLAFKNAVSNLQSAVERCTKSLKALRPDLDISPIASDGKETKVVKKQFADDSVVHLYTPTIMTAGFPALQKVLNDYKHYLEGGFSVDVANVSSEDTGKALENIAHYEQRLAELKKQLRLLDSVIAGTTIKFKEFKNDEAQEEKFNLANLKETKPLIGEVIRELDAIQTDFNGAKVLLEEKK